MEVMTLNEAIQHCEEVAKENREYAEDALDRYNLVPNDITKQEHDRCKQCATKYRQLAEWLKDYKRLKEQEDVLDEIKIEIADICCGQYCENSLTPYAVRETALEIIDKYRAERLFER